MGDSTGGLGVIWFLLLGGLLLIVLGVWGGPQRRRRADKTSRIPREATVQEAWEILTSPVEYEEELIKIPEHKPWFVPGTDRRFQQGLLVGLGAGLLVAALVYPSLPGKETTEPQVAVNPPTQNEKPAADKDPASQPPQGEQPAGQPPQGGQQPAGQSPQTPPPPTPANVTFTVEPGSPSQEIATNLKAAGLIADEAEFLDLVAAYGVETQLKAGTFVIPTGASVDTIIAKLTE